MVVIVTPTVVRHDLEDLIDLIFVKKKHGGGRGGAREGAGVKGKALSFCTHDISKVRCIDK